MRVQTKRDIDWCTTTHWEVLVSALMAYVLTAGCGEMFRLRCRFLDKVSHPLACPTPFTLEHLSLDEGRLDEIYTNNESV